MSGFELLVLALWADGTMGGLISLLLSLSQRVGQLQWQVAGFARERDAFLPLSLELLESHPGFPKLGQQGARLHACCRFARALAETQLGLWWVHVCCLHRWVRLLLSARPQLPGPHRGALSSRPDTAHADSTGGVPASRTCPVYRHTQPSLALQDVAQQMPCQTGKAAAL